jgi:hypothetical protein
VDVTALVLNEDLAAEVEQAPLGRHEYFPELPPRLWHGLFRVQPLLAAGSDIATGAGLDYKVDLRNFLPGELSGAYAGCGGVTLAHFSCDRSG